MCGIAGVANLGGEPVSSGLVDRMTALIAHRGPDGEGVYTDGPVGLGHRRLAIIDLTDAGHQPMANEDGDVVLVYNGEIYNFQELRVELEALGHRFRSQTDTEVLVHAYEEWGNGLRRALQRHVRVRDLGPRPRAALPRARPLRDQAALLVPAATALFSSPPRSRRSSRIRASRGTSATRRSTSTSPSRTSSPTGRCSTGVRLLPPGCTLTLEVGAGAEPKIERYWDFPFPEEPAEHLGRGVRPTSSTSSSSRR